jgi:hypothetical protein
MAHVFCNCLLSLGILVCLHTSSHTISRHSIDSIWIHWFDAHLLQCCLTSFFMLCLSLFLCDNSTPATTLCFVFILSYAMMSTPDTFNWLPGGLTLSLEQPVDITTNTPCDVMYLLFLSQDNDKFYNDFSSSSYYQHWQQNHTTPDNQWTLHQSPFQSQIQTLLQTQRNAICDLHLAQFHVFLCLCQASWSNCWKLCTLYTITQTL